MKFTKYANTKLLLFAEQICIFESEVKMPFLSITSEIVGRAVYNLNPLNGAPVERLPLFFYFKGAKYEY